MWRGGFVRLTGQLQYHCLMLKVNVIELMRLNTAIAYCALWIALYRVGWQSARKNSSSTKLQTGYATCHSSRQADRPVNRRATDKSLAGIIEGDSNNAHWKTTTKESAKSSQASAKTISFADGAKKRSIINDLICMPYFNGSSIGV